MLEKCYDHTKTTTKGHNKNHLVKCEQNRIKCGSVTVCYFLTFECVIKVYLVNKCKISYMRTQVTSYLPLKVWSSTVLLVLKLTTLKTSGLALLSSINCAAILILTYYLCGSG